METARPQLSSDKHTNAQTRLMGLPYLHTLTPFQPPQLIGSPMAVPLVVSGMYVVFS